MSLDSNFIEEFKPINPGYDTIFKANELSIGLILPIENYDNSAFPTMKNQLSVVQYAEQLGFKAIWLRDIPFEIPAFDDVGQIYDPWVYLGILAVSTQTIALGIASTVITLRHPAHIAKAAASIDQLSNGRFILGIASGDRPTEYPAMNFNFEERDIAFREAYDYIRVVGKQNPEIDNLFGKLKGNMDIVPKPYGDQLAILITGRSRQSIDWIVTNTDGWMNYPKSMLRQKEEIADYREKLMSKGLRNKPTVQPLYVDLFENKKSYLEEYHLGLRCDSKRLIKYLNKVKNNGVNHVILNLRFNKVDIIKTLEKLAQEVLPEFHSL